MSDKGFCPFYCSCHIINMTSNKPEIAIKEIIQYHNDVGLWKQTALVVVWFRVCKENTHKDIQIYATVSQILCLFMYLFISFSDVF